MDGCVGGGPWATAGATTTPPSPPPPPPSSSRRREMPAGSIRAVGIGAPATRHAMLVAARAMKGPLAGWGAAHTRRPPCERRCSELLGISLRLREAHAGSLLPEWLPTAPSGPAPKL
eukprot:scaffold7912_cov484-Prasinococcus_capsulatus_cf.AAC.1